LILKTAQQTDQSLFFFPGRTGNIDQIENNLNLGERLCCQFLEVKIYSFIREVKARGVHKYQLSLLSVVDTPNAVTRGLWYRRDYGHLVSADPIDQS
jgi:hypothetical protein